jgi:hypothetical protein
MPKSSPHLDFQSPASKTNLFPKHGQSLIKTAVNCKLQLCSFSTHTLRQLASQHLRQARWHTRPPSNNKANNFPVNLGNSEVICAISRHDIHGKQPFLLSFGRLLLNVVLSDFAERARAHTSCLLTAQTYFAQHNLPIADYRPILPNIASK